MDYAFFSSAAVHGEPEAAVLNVIYVHEGLRGPDVDCTVGAIMPIFGVKGVSPYMARAVLAALE
eukprot:10388870-Lingulodinium_polyedra.AAC.1